MIIPDGGRGAHCAATGGAFAHLYQRHYDAVFAFAYRRTGDRMRAEDVTAQTFLQALQAFPRYEDRGAPISAWLLRIAANVIAGQARRGPHGLTLSDTAIEHALQGRQPDGGHADWVERWERARWVRAHLAALPVDGRRAVWLRYGEDRALEDVAGHVGRSPAATKQLLHRTLKTLRARMQPEIQIGGDQ